MLTSMHSSTKDEDNVTHEALRGEPGRALDGIVSFEKNDHVDLGVRKAALITFC